PKFIPEDIFEADAGLVMADYNRAFYDSGFAAGVVGRVPIAIAISLGRHSAPPHTILVHDNILDGIFTRATCIASLD
ncbi:MAG: hypothetical protein WCB49_02190, partial [Gammaproteobacteria bacterium]